MPYIIAIVIVLIAGVTFTLLRSDNSAAPSEAAPTATSASTEVRRGIYADGTYTTQVSYQTPKRDEYLMDVTFILTDDIVTDASIAYSQGGEKDPNAQRFDAAYRTEVIGMSLDSINLSRVGGASLTTNAFNEAVTKIKADATS